MKDKIPIILFLCFFGLSGTVEKNSHKSIVWQIEQLDRGIVAVRTGADSVFISWRVLGTDPDDIGFNIYRGTRKINTKTLTGATNFIDRNPANDTYSVRAVIKGKEQKEQIPARSGHRIS